MVSGAGENLMVNDPDEAWVFHILGTPDSKSAVWAAARVPDGHVATVANAFQIRQMDLEDSENYLASPNILSLARELGFWTPKHEGETASFDFTKAYSAGEYTSPYYSGRRHWRVFDKIAPKQKYDPSLGWNREHETYPFAVKPDSPLDISDFAAIYRDYYEDTPFSLVEPAMASGPWQSPARYDQGAAEKSAEFGAGAWERTIGLYRTSMINLSQSRKGKDKGVLWIMMSRPESGVFVPMMMEATDSEDAKVCFEK